jgi:hypothetical protein
MARFMKYLAVTLLGVALHCQALENSTPTEGHPAVGSLGEASGVQVSENWVLTAAHVAVKLVANQTEFRSPSGTSVVSEIHVYTSDSFPAHDIALVRLQNAIRTDVPSITTHTFTQDTLVAEKVTIVSGRRGQFRSGGSTLYMVRDELRLGLTPYRVNWVFTQGGALVTAGDSGGALFKHTSEGAVLTGITAAHMRNTLSAFIQVAHYRDWIDNVMRSSDQTVKWTN